MNLPEATLHTTPAPMWTVYCDGSAMPNPGRMGLGAVITAPDGSRQQLSLATGTVGCNNEAEAKALTMALKALKTQGARAVLIYTDSSILVAQLGGKPVPPIAALTEFFDAARALLRTFDQTELRWIPRHRNGEADTLARAALGFGPKPAAKPFKRKKRR